MTYKYKKSTCALHVRVHDQHRKLLATGYTVTEDDVSLFLHHPIKYKINHAKNDDGSRDYSVTGHLQSGWIATHPLTGLRVVASSTRDGAAAEGFDKMRASDKEDLTKRVMLYLAEHGDITPTHYIGGKVGDVITTTTEEEGTSNE